MFRLALFVLCLALLLPACNGTSSLPAPEFFDEQPVLSQSWVPIGGEPAWVADPPTREGTRRIVVTGKSNLRSIAAHEHRPFPDKVFHKNIREAFAPLLGDADAAAAAAAHAIEQMKLLQRACKDEVLTRRMVPGNTLSTVWALWELPLDDAVAPLPEEHRAAARDLLATIDLLRPLGAK